MASESLSQEQLLLSIRDTARALGLSRAQLFRLRATRDFPEPLRLLGPASHPRWRVTDLAIWLAAQLEPYLAPEKEEMNARQ